MKNLAFLALSGVLLLGAVACDNNAKTSADAPTSTTAANNGSTNAKSNTPTPSKESAQNSEKDASSNVRKAQLDSDIRAREQRNNVAGDKTKRDDSDLASEVRSKLEANLPASQLVVNAKDGAVTISGTVPTQEQLNKIDTLAKQIKGVQGVTVDAKVAAAR